MVAKSLMVVPPGFRVSTAVIDGEATSVFVAKTHRKGFKTPKKTRDLIRARMKEIRIPVLTIAANAVPVIETTVAVAELLKMPQNHDLQRHVVNAPLGAYTGINFNRGWTPFWDGRLLLKGLVPNAVVWAVNKIGIFKSVNQKIARTRLPVRLN